MFMYVHLLKAASKYSHLNKYINSNAEIFNVAAQNSQIFMTPFCH